MTSALAERLTDEVGDAVQASGVIADNVPSELQPLLPVLGGAVRGFVSGEVDKFLQSDTGQQLMVGAVRRTHARGDPRCSRARTRPVTSCRSRPAR